MADEPGDSPPPERDGTDGADSGSPDGSGTGDPDAAEAPADPGDGGSSEDSPDDPGTPDESESSPLPDASAREAFDVDWPGADGEVETADAAGGADDATATAGAGPDPTLDDMGIQTTDQPSADGGYAEGADPELYEEFDDSYEDYPTEGAPDDEEMPLADHIEEMVRRLGVVILVIAVVSGVTFPVADRLINFLWFSYLPGSIANCPDAAATADAISRNADGIACPRVYNPLALVLARLKVATLVGFVAALPVFVYETYLFMRPGLFPRERRYYLASVPTSLVLAAVGVLFAHFLVLPVLFTYFLYYSTDATTMIAFGLAQTFDLMVLMLGGFALIFQIPLFVMLALMMGLVTRRWLAERRILFWGAFAGLAFLFSPDPTGMAPILVAATMIVLFEGTLLLRRWTERASPA